MKRILQTLVIGILLPILTGCGADLKPFEDGSHRVKREKEKPVMKTIRMSLGGDLISETEEPLLRADDGDTYVGINVFRTEKDNPDAKEEKYAYGLFKNKDGISVDLLTGYTYRFEATVLIEREDKLVTINKRINRPFRIIDSVDNSFSDFETDDIGTFHYCNDVTEYGRIISFMELSTGAANVDAGIDLPAGNGLVKFPRVKRFYGSVDSFDPALEPSVEIDMNYKCFGIKFELMNLPSGYVTVKDASPLDANRDKDVYQEILFPADLRLTEEGTSEWECLYSMHDLTSDSKTLTLEFSWNKGGSEPETFKSEVTVRPKMKKILKLNITGTPNYETKGNITLIMDNEELSEEEQLVNGNFK